MPKIKTEDLNRYVVMGQVNTNDSLQTVNISLTSSINNPVYVPVTGCTVVISDDQDHQFPMADQGDGDYKVRIDPKYIVDGAAFRVKVQTPKGETLESDYDTINAGPPIDSVYYELRNIPQAGIGDTIRGIQIYVNLMARPDQSHYYLWNMHETWEYHSKWPIEWYYDGTVHHIYPPDSSRMVCWRTKKIPNTFTLNTSNLTQNEYIKFPLNFVSNKTIRLQYGYSLLIEQEALSRAAYDFWERMKLNNSTEGGLYEHQPLTIQGNVHNITHPDQNVLGYFSAVSAYSKRFFINPVPGLPMDYPQYCHITFLRKGIRGLLPYEYPVYLLGDVERYYPFSLTSDCVDCLLLGGTNVKPSFWPKNK